MIVAIVFYAPGRNWYDKSALKWIITRLMSEGLMFNSGSTGTVFVAPWQLYSSTEPCQIMAKGDMGKSRYKKAFGAIKVMNANARALP